MSEEDGPTNKWRGTYMFALGCGVTLLFGWVSSVGDMAERERLARANALMMTRLEELHEKLPNDVRAASEQRQEEGIETWIFICVMALLALNTVRFLLREYKLLCRTRSKIVAAAEHETEDSEPDEVRRVHDETITRQHLVRNFIFYRLDYWFSASGYSKPLALLFLTLVLIINGGGMYYTVKSETLGGAMWQAWAFIADSGAHADENETAGRIVGLFLTIGGMLVFALVIGLISDAISDEFDSLKRGKARVIETDHTLILGWTDKTLPLIREIANANESLVKEGKTCVICVLAEVDKEVMEQETRNTNINLRGSMLVFRKGNPTVLHDLQHVSAKTSRSVIVLSPIGLSADEADAKSLRVVLCLVGLGYKQGHVTVEIADVDNRELVHIIGGHLVETVVAHDFIGRLIIQSSRQKGLAPILERILGFEGCEFYMEEWPELIGKAFSDVLFSFEDAIPIGVKLEDTDAAPGETLLNPPDDFVMKPGMQVIVLSEDDDTYKPSAAPLCVFPPPKAKRISPVRTPLRQEKVLFVGWRRDLADMLRELDEVVAPGSTLTLFSGVPLLERYAQQDNLFKLSTSLGTIHYKHNTHTTGTQSSPQTGGQAISPSGTWCSNRQQATLWSGMSFHTFAPYFHTTLSRRELEKLPVEDYDSIFILADEEFEVCITPPTPPHPTPPHPMHNTPSTTVRYGKCRWTVPHVVAANSRHPQPAS